MLKLYNPKSATFVTLPVSDQINLPMQELLLFNILIELQVQTQYLAASGLNNPSESPEYIRSALTTQI